MLLIALIPDADRRLRIYAGDGWIFILSTIIAVNRGQRFLSLITISSNNGLDLSGSRLRFNPPGFTSDDFKL